LIDQKWNHDLEKNKKKKRNPLTFTSREKWAGKRQKSRRVDNASDLSTKKRRYDVSPRMGKCPSSFEQTTNRDKRDYRKRKTFKNLLRLAISRTDKMGIANLQAKVQKAGITHPVYHPRLPMKMGSYLMV